MKPTAVQEELHKKQSNGSETKLLSTKLSSEYSKTSVLEESKKASVVELQQLKPSPSIKRKEKNDATENAGSSQALVPKKKSSVKFKRFLAALKKVVTLKIK